MKITSYRCIYIIHCLLYSYACNYFVTGNKNEYKFSLCFVVYYIKQFSFLITAYEWNKSKTCINRQLNVLNFRTAMPYIQFNAKICCST